MSKLIGSALILVVCFSWMMAGCGKKQLEITEEEAIAAIQHFDSGWVAKDSSMVSAVLHPAYNYFTQSGGMFSRDSIVVTAASPSYTLSKMLRSGIEVEVIGNVALANTRWEGVGQYRGQPFNEDQRCSITLIKQKNGKVYILSEHCTPIKGRQGMH